jgi:hypothetical protein
MSAVITRVTGRQLLDNMGVGDIKTRGHLNGPNETRRWRAQHLVGDQRRRYLQAFRRAKDDFLDDDRTGVGIDPYLHQCSLPSTRGCIRKGM